MMEGEGCHPFPRLGPYYPTKLEANERRFSQGVLSEVINLAYIRLNKLTAALGALKMLL